MTAGSLPSEPQTPRIDTTVSHSARIWNYWLGGKDNFPVDQEVGDQILGFVPELVRSARADRQFLSRAVRYLAGEEGIRQFLDIGTGLPTVDNTHQVAQRIAPESRIVYVDNDPLVLAHAHALLSSTSEGACDYIEADLRDPDSILRQAAKTLDFTQPVAIMMLGIINFVIDTAQAQRIVRQLIDALPPGSYLTISHPTTEVDAAPMIQAVQFWNEQGSAPMTLRTREEVLSLFDGMDLVEPGVVTCSRWRADPTEVGEITDVTHFGGVARKN
jgi:O-methyltransferase involved in polyketide biosynthesis